MGITTVKMSGSASLPLLLALIAASVVAQEFKPITMSVNNGEGKDSTVSMGTSGGKATLHSKNNEFKVTMNGNEVFAYTPLEQNVDNAFTEQVLGTMRIGSFAANSIVAEDFEARSDDFPNQNWLAARMDTFTNGTDGWQILPVALSAGSADNEDLGTSKCGGLGEILGGPCKTSYDTMWMKAGSPGTVSVSPPVWAEEYTWCPQFFTFMCNGGVSACGKAHYPDKLSRLVTVSMEHSAP